jgi:hypothetical protein
MGYYTQNGGFIGANYASDNRGVFDLTSHQLDVPNPIVTSNLILHLDAGNSSSYGGSGTTWTDLSTEGNNVTISGATYNSGSPSYFDFDGTDDYLDAGSALSDSYWQGNWTVSLWVYLDNLNTAGGSSMGHVFFHHGSASTYSGLHLIQRQSKYHLGLFFADLQSTSTPSTTTWVNLTFTLNNTTRDAEIYINGSSDNSGTLASSYSGSGSNCRIGGKTWGTHDDGWLNGRISTVLCYDTVLSSTQINSNYQGTKAAYGH